MKKLNDVVAACGDRIKVFSDILTYGSTFFQHDPAYDLKSVEKRLKKVGAAGLLQGFSDVLKQSRPFDAPNLEKALQDFCAGRSIKPAELVHPLRVATTGVEVGIGLFDSLAILGRDEVLRRIELALRLV
jgi:glutamyl-tRNA synthetase